jgi:hypothetical protein
MFLSKLFKHSYSFSFFSGRATFPFLFFKRQCQHSISSLSSPRPHSPHLILTAYVPFPCVPFIYAIFFLPSSVFLFLPIPPPTFVSSFLFSSSHLLLVSFPCCYYCTGPCLVLLLGNFFSSFLFNSFWSSLPLLLPLVLLSFTARHLRMSVF